MKQIPVSLRPSQRSATYNKSDRTTYPYSQCAVRREVWMQCIRRWVYSTPIVNDSISRRFEHVWVPSSSFIFSKRTGQKSYIWSRNVPSHLKGLHKKYSLQGLRTPNHSLHLLIGAIQTTFGALHDIRKQNSNTSSLLYKRIMIYSSKAINVRQRTSPWNHSS